MFCPDCGTWNRGSAVICGRCSHELPELSDAPAEKPDEEMALLRRAAGGRYRIHRRLGSGGMATVYAAKQMPLGRELVVKVLLGHLARDPEMRERFQREAEASAQLVHPYICPILDYGELETTVFSRDAVPGGRLARRPHRARGHGAAGGRRERVRAGRDARSTTRIATASCIAT